MAEANITNDLLAAPGTHGHVTTQWAGQRRKPISSFFGYLGLLLVALVIGVPVYWMIICAFKTTQEVYRIPPTWIPAAPTFENFPRAWDSAPFGRYYINT